MILAPASLPPGNRSWSSTSCAAAKSTGPAKPIGAHRARCSTRASPCTIWAGPAASCPPWAGLRPADRARVGGPGRALSLGPHPAPRGSALRSSIGLRHDHRAGRERAAAEVEELDRFRSAYAEEVGPGRGGGGDRLFARGCAESFYRDLLQRTPCPAVFDFRGEGLLSVFDLKPYVVKPNREELARTVGRPLETDEDLLGAMRSLNRRGGRVGGRHPGRRGRYFSLRREGPWRLHPRTAGRWSTRSAAATPCRDHRLGHPCRPAAAGGRPAGRRGSRAERPPTAPLPPRPGGRWKGKPRRSESRRAERNRRVGQGRRGGRRPTKGRIGGPALACASLSHPTLTPRNNGLSDMDGPTAAGCSDQQWAGYLERARQGKDRSPRSATWCRPRLGLRSGGDLVGHRLVAASRAAVFCRSIGGRPPSAGSSALNPTATWPSAIASARCIAVRWRRSAVGGRLDRRGDRYFRAGAPGRAEEPFFANCTNSSAARRLLGDDRRSRHPFALLSSLAQRSG